MKHKPVLPDLRVCASGEPKPERKEPGPRPIPGAQQVDETGNVLSTTGSQGLRKSKSFGTSKS